MEVPFILILAIEENASAFFNGLRRAYFPGEGKLIDAYLPVFQLLPSEQFIIDDLRSLAKSIVPFSVNVPEPVATDSGVVYSVESDELERIHETLCEKWRSFLIPQDLKPFRPQITIQDGASASDVTSLLDFLRQHFSSFPVKATGLQLWEFRGEPSVLHTEFNFTGYV